jgi:hypothetical protein
MEPQAAVRRSGPRQCPSTGPFGTLRIFDSGPPAMAFPRPILQEGAEEAEMAAVQLPPRLRSQVQLGNEAENAENGLIWFDFTMFVFTLY